MTPLAVILYEDQRGPEKEFGLHNLVVACVADDAGEDGFALRRKLDGRPMKGKRGGRQAWAQRSAWRRALGQVSTWTGP